jgi:hypothetical protein
MSQCFIIDDMNPHQIPQLPALQTEDALRFIVQWVREGSRSPYSSYGYDIYIPNVIGSYVTSLGFGESHPQGSRLQTEFSPTFFDAAWELCRRGIIRPGVRTLRAQSTEQGHAGSGYSITPFGRRWIEEAESDIFVPMEPERFAQMVAPFRKKFGSGFHARAQEAVRCYGAHAYLACCTMCGAAAESILLETAIAKVGDEAQVLKMYASASGRMRIENTLIGKAREQLVREFRGFTILLRYWRDEAAHGTASNIADNEAYTALAMLLRYAMFVSANWDELIARNP